MKSFFTLKNHSNVLALLVTIAMLTLTFYYLQTKRQEHQVLREHEFGDVVAHNYKTIKHRLSEMAVTLRGVKGYYEGSEEVTHGEYKDYFSALALGDELSGFKAIGIAPLVSNEALPAYLHSRHHHGPLQHKHRIYPEGERDEYAPISFIEPEDEKNINALGFDLLTNAEAKKALLRARDSGEIALTGKLYLVQDVGKILPASVMYVPIYKERKPLTTVQERRNAHVGWVTGPFRIVDLMNDLAEELSKDVKVVLYVKTDGGTESLLYGDWESAHQNEGGPGLELVKHLMFGGVEWKMQMYALPSFDERFDSMEYLPLILGLMLSFLMGGLIWLLGHSRANAVELANEMTRELKESEATFRSMADTVPLVIYVSHKDSRVSEYVNPTFAGLFGYTMNDVPTTDAWWEIACPDEAYRAQVMEEWQAKINEAALTQTKTEPMEVVVTCIKGYRKYISWRLIVLGNKVYAFGYDLTDIRKAESELQIAATAFESQSGVMVIDAYQNILRVNKAFKEITGYTLQDVKGKGVDFFNSGQQDVTFYKKMWETIDAKGFWNGEVWNRRKGGEVYPEALNITSVTKDSHMPSYYVATFTDITSAKAAAEEIQNLAFFDSLTRLPNRRYLLDKLDDALTLSKRNNQIGALLFLDLDHFKTLNDTLGHDAGDLLLQKVAERLLLCTRKSDTIARLGGDEFVLLLEELMDKEEDYKQQVEGIALKILTALTQPYDLDGNSYFSSSSIGITLFGGENSQVKVEDLLRQADIAMYQAKASGRNTLRFFDPQMQDAVSARAAMEIELRTAIRGKQFQLHYQIQVDDKGEVFGVEALIRWLHPEKGMVSPIQFISLAEDTGLIIPIGQWVLETACKQLVVWQQEEQTQHLCISLNVSAKQFHQQDFVSHLSAMIQRYEVNPNLLKLELTESMLLEDIDHTITIMNELKAIGLQFELDDFGTGYSSLQYLKRLPLSQLKIDQSFVRDIVIDSSDRAIVLTIITMAHTLGLEVIAEGVETEEQRQYLLENGCANFQGYLFSKPLPIDQLEKLLLSSKKAKA